MHLLLVILLSCLFGSPVYAKLVTQEVPYSQNGTTLKGYLAYDFRCHWREEARSVGGA